MARRLFDAHFHVVDPAHPLVVGGEQAADDVFWNNAAGWYLR